MARNRELDDALDELKMLHDAKNHDYATAENPYKNLEGVQRIGIELWRGIVIRLMDKFERVEQFCRSGELAIKSEGLEDTFKDIAIYSTLAMILYRKGEDNDFMREWEKRPKSTKQVDKALEWKEIERKKKEYENMHPMQAMRQIAEDQMAEEQQRSEENLAHIKSTMQRGAENN